MPAPNPLDGGASLDSRDESGDPGSKRRADTAVNIGMDALDLAKRARAAGLASVAHMLETAALQAGSEASAARWPSDDY